MGPVRALPNERIQKDNFHEINFMNEILFRNITTDFPLETNSND